MKSGCVFPPSCFFSINVLPGNRAILFGGITIVDQEIHRSNDIFIVFFTNNTVVSNINYSN